MPVEEFLERGLYQGVRYELVDGVPVAMAGPTLGHIVIVDPGTPQVFHWSRSPNEPWTHVLPEGLDAVIHSPRIEGTIDLASLYEGLTCRPQPRRVRGGDPAA